MGNTNFSPREDFNAKIKNSNQVIKSHTVSNFHVSCESYRPKYYSCGDENLGGVVLYLKDGEEDWWCNGKHCKIGYIIIKRIKDLHGISSQIGQIHGRVYKSVFNCEPHDIVGSGFAFDPKSETWKYNSASFNDRKDSYHNDLHTVTMGDLEKTWIEKAVQNWIWNGQQNTTVTDDVVIHENYK